MAVIINAVVANSIAEELEIEPGDILLSVDGRAINDILDYQFYSREDEIVIEIQKPSDEIWSIEIEKDYDDDLGLLFDDIIFDKMKRCKNRCVFCFVDQLPRGMRKTLYVKDDDYRLSFLTGNFITLTNLTAKDWQKIINMRLSPLYVSIHCLRPELRAELLGHPRGASIKADLSRLKEAGIEIHTQVVLCPGLNDGEILEETISGLADFSPSLRSVGIVPVGLTGHRRKLQALRPLTSSEAEALIALVDQQQIYFRKQFDLGLVYLADEIFILAGRDFPSASYYDDYPQLENGIGLARILLDEFATMEDLLPEKIEAKEVILVTGVSAIKVLDPIIERLNQITGLTVTLLPIENHFFAGNVTVTGLLTGNDIINRLGEKYKGKEVILPEVVLKDASRVLLDDLSIAEIEQRSGTRIRLVDGSAASLIEAVLGIGI